MSESSRPGIATRMRAALRHERDASDLEALRDAGNWVYQELSEAEQARGQMLADGQNLWTAPRSVGGYLVASWNAFALHSLGAGLLAADYATDRGTTGYVPAVTFEQAWSWFSAAEGWLSQARQAHRNPDFDLAAVLRIPAALPAWAEVRPCPATHVRAMLVAVPPLREHAELALFELEKHTDTDERRRLVNALRQEAARAGAAADYALALAPNAPSERLRDLVENNIRSAASAWFRVGQLAAMPGLLSAARAVAPSLIDPEILPGGVRFDAWCLTDPQTRGWWQSDRRARSAIEALWAADPDPAHTLTIHAQIQAALASGAIVPVSGKGQASHFFTCPWYPMYQVRRRVRINNQRLSVPQQFTLDVSAEAVARGGAFQRRIVRGPFTSTDDVEYGGPDGRD
jgi:hypothetical protein